MGHSRFRGSSRALRRLGSLLAAGMLAGSQLLVPVAQAAAIPTDSTAAMAPAAPTAITIHAFAARTEANADIGPVTINDPVTTYKWMINVDNTGSTGQRSPADGCSPSSAGYPDSCLWASIAGLKSSAPVAAQGSTVGSAGGTTTVSLEPGRYLVSVLADGYKLDGTPFTVPVTGQVDVPLQPLPLPTATIKAQVFADVTSANGQYDPGEDGISGWAGKITDYLGQVNTDVFGNPLCTTYAFADSNGNGVQDQLWDPTWTNAPESIILTGGEPTVTHQGGKCLTGDINMDGVVDGPASTPGTDEWLYADLGLDAALARGVLTIPNLGPNRYALSIVPKTGSSWVQTTTLEGNHDWDAWVMEGSTGLDTEFVVAGEPFPATIFGYVPGPGNPYWNDPGHQFAAGGTGTIKGVVDAMKVYVPATGGACLPGTIWGGLCGGKIDKPIDQPWIALSDLNAQDVAVYVGRGNADGTFEITGVPDGSYTLTYWDDPQNYILDLIQVTVANGETVDMGVLPLSGWFTKFDGTIFSDDNRNGVRDAGEHGVPNFGLTLRKRENSLMDRGATAVSTDASGYYEMVNAYPLTEWLVLEAYDDRYYTTGITYQADNQPTPTTVLGQGVDVSVLPIIGLSGTLDWGVHAYDATGANGVDPQNGGIVGSISYDTTRNELDPQYAAAEDWQPGVSGIPVELYATVPCGTNVGTPCDVNGNYELTPDGSYARGKLLNTYLSETWERPTGCVARGVDGTPLVHGTDEQVLPLGADDPCLEGPLMGVQFGPYPTDQTNPAIANFGAAVDGNYGFGDGCFDGTLDATDPSAPTCTDSSTGTTVVPFTPLGADDYLVHIDLTTGTQANVYKVTREEDINIGNGDTFVPQVPPPSCAGAFHQVDVAGLGTDGYGPATVTDPSGNGGVPISVPASTPTDNLTFVDIGGSPYEGQARPLCDTKLVTLQNGKSVVPMFNVFTDVPLPGRFFALNNSDLQFSTDPKSLLYGEKAGIPFNPVGIYDFANRLITTVETDYNGLFDVLLPSTNRINCPTPSGVCANLYRFVGNDPGVPGRLNLNYNPQYRTIAAEFETFPGMIIPADTAPTQVGVTVQLPGAQTQAISCPVAPTTPELYAVSQPWVQRPSGSTLAPFTISGTGFGASKGTGQVTLDGVPLATASWSDSQIVANVTSSTAYGPHQLKITAANGASTVNGLTLHVVLGGSGNSSYNPAIFEVGPGRTYAPAETLPAAADHAIQRALDAAATFVAASNSNANRGALVVVYPNNTSANPRQNPRGAYYENLIIAGKVKLQGVGPGSPTGAVRGTIIDGGAFGGDSPVATDWYARIGALTWAGNQTIYDGAVVSLFLPSNGRNAFPTSFNANTAPSIDGFDLRGGDQQGFPGNINVIGGGPTGLPGGLITQGGAIFANAYARNLQITNNVIQNNGGAYGTIRIGSPDLPSPDTDAQNDDVRIANNRIIANGGTNLAGGIGLFAGSERYVVTGNDICGNFSAEYGGGIGHYGLSPNGSIDHNRIYYNQSYDEGGGIMIAGALPVDPTANYGTANGPKGAGAVTIHDNLIQANMANDDGGGIRFLMAGNFPTNVYNNMIVNNVSTHEGGGIALDDAPNVRVYNNTVMKNVTTATAVTSNGQPAPAGLSTGQNSAQLQATLPGGSPLFSNPLLFNDIFWDNRAGTRSLATVTGIGATGDATPINNWDLGAADGSGVLAPTNSIVQQSAGTHPYTTSATNSAANPAVVSPYDTLLAFAPWRTNPNFVGAILVAADLPPLALGDYHLVGCPASPACNLGAASKAVPAYQQAPANLAAPTTDIDGQSRPAGGGFDSGADEFAAIAATADLSITKTDGLTSVNPGASVTYTIVVSNSGPNTASGATVTDNFPASLTVGTWTCTASVSSSCTATGTGNARSGSVTLVSGGSATYTANTTLAATAAGNLVNTATVAAPGGVTDPNAANNSATDTDTVILPLPTVAVLDAFTRANANSLGASWNQATLFGAASIRVNTNQAFALLPGQANWNVTTFGAKQGAGFTFATAPATGASLLLKVTNGAGSANNPANYIRVQYQTTGGGQVLIQTTTNGNNLFPTFTTLGTLPSGAFASGDRLTAVANANGSVDAWRTTAANVTTYLGRTATSAFTGTGRIGIQLPLNARVDDFRGATVP